MIEKLGAHGGLSLRAPLFETLAALEAKFPVFHQLFKIGRRLGAAIEVRIKQIGDRQRQFGADETIVGRSITVDGKPCMVVGVLPASFSIYRVLNRELQVFRPIVVDWTDREQSLNVYAKLRPGASVEMASAELSAVYASLPIPGHQWSAGAASLSASFASKGRSVVLLVLWVGISALMRGVTEIVLAFRLRGARRDAIAV